MANVISLYPKISDIKNSKNIPIDIFLDYIKDGQWQDQVLKIRLIKEKEERQKAKKSLPYVTVSGLFESRTDKGLTEHSGFIAIDLDDVDIEVRSFLHTDPYVFACFISVSGTGLCVIFKINGDKHRESFSGICEYLYSHYRLIADPTSVNISRPRYVSYDPDLYRNLNSIKFTQYPQYKAPTKIPLTIYAQTDFEILLKTIQERSLNLCENYHEWVRLGFAFADKFGKEGRSYFHIVSNASGKYNYTDCERQYTNCLKAHGSTLATISTFFYYCKQAGMQLYTPQTKMIINAAIGAKKSGRDQQGAAQVLEKFEEISPDVSLPIINQVFESQLENTPEENIIDQLQQYFKHNYNFKRNEITRYIENNGRILKQKELNSIYLATKKVYPSVTYDLIERLINSDTTIDYNPIKEFFDGSEATTGHIEALFSSINTDNLEFAQKFGKKWIVGSVASIYGTHCPLMLILSGNVQNTGKTEFFRRLPCVELKPYFGESKLDAGKDDEILMTQKMWIYDDEMSGKNKKEVARMKELISKQTFSLREPYGRNNVDLDRIATLCGSTNENDILHDPTGSRRFIPIRTNSINFEKYNAVNKRELWLEAYSLYKSGFDWRLSKEDIDYMKPNNEQFESYSLEYELITKYVQPGYSLMTATDIKVLLEEKTKQKLILEKIGREMIRAGYEKITQRINGMPKKCYKCSVIGGELTT